MRPNVKALTFVELFIVVIIIGILAGLSIPNFRRSFDSAQLEGFSRQLQSYMNYLRDKSVVEQKVIYLTINIDKKQYSSWLQDVGQPFKSYSIPEGIKVEISKKSNTDDPQIYFYPDGRIDAVNIKVSSASSNVVLTTEGAFGKVKIIGK